MLDHILFNKIRYIPAPKQLTLRAGTKVYEGTTENNIFTTSEAGNTVEVVGQMNGWYLIKGNIGHYDNSNHQWVGKEYNTVPGCIKASDIGMGGVISSLIYRLIAACRRVAIAW